MAKRKPHRVHRWRIASRELQRPGKIVYACGYRTCDAVYVGDMRTGTTNVRKLSSYKLGREALRIFGDDLTGQETLGL